MWKSEVNAAVPSAHASYFIIIIVIDTDTKPEARWLE